jgi:RimJ/RimL family protein N-acetyltransferase
MFARTDRLLLRPIWPEDAEALYNAVADEAIARNLALAPWPYTIGDARSFAAIEHDLRFPNFLMFQRTEGAPRLIGSCGIGNKDGTPELGYWIARPYWGLGYASEGVRAVIDIAKAIGHRHLVSGHFTDNPASGHVLRKAGFRSTGRIEMRHSKGRGQAAPCVLFERFLLSEEDDGFSGPRDTMMPYDAQLIAA